jgi:hypothetical protein
METSIAFHSTIGMEITYGGPTEAFTSLKIGPNYLNLEVEVSWAPTHIWVCRNLRGLNSFFSYARQNSCE